MENSHNSACEALFRAFFERGEDISNIDVLVNLARDLQLDDSSLRTALESKQFEPSVIADEREATELGMHAVPAFVFNRRFALTGVQPVAALEQWQTARPTLTNLSQQLE
jgi:predicted DsbA family dithiol-disulfide isomerase